MNQPETFHIAQSLRADHARTWCGADINRELDVLPHEAAVIVANNQQHAGYVRCVACFNRLMLADFEETVRVED